MLKASRPKNITLSPRPISALLVLCFFALAARPAHALTIVRNFLGGTPSQYDTGSGNLQDIFNAAADIWELAIQDDHTLTIGYAWSPIGNAQHHLRAQGGTPHRQTEGFIYFNNDNSPGSFHFYLDPTPWESSEFPDYSEAEADLGGGLVNIKRLLAGGPRKMDLLTVALHEIGHALGLSVLNDAYYAEAADGDIHLLAPMPHAGTWLPIMMESLFSPTSHLEFLDDAYNLTAGGFGDGQRLLPTDVDMLASGMVSSFYELNFELAPKLKIEKAGRNLVFSWIEPLGKHVLEQSTPASAQWTRVNAPAVENKGRWSVTLPVQSAGKVYRLRRIALP